MRDIGRKRHSRRHPPTESDRLPGTRGADLALLGIYESRQLMARRRVAALPLNEQIDACEDREWSYRVMRAGYTLIADPDLWVSAEHRFSAGPRALFARTRREARALALLAPGGPYYSLHDAWNEIVARDAGTGHVRPKSLLRPARYAQAAGRLVGEQEIRLRRGGDDGRRSATV